MNFIRPLYLGYRPKYSAKKEKLQSHILPTKDDGFEFTQKNFFCLPPQKLIMLV